MMKDTRIPPKDPTPPKTGPQQYREQDTSRTQASLSLDPRNVDGIERTPETQLSSPNVDLAQTQSAMAPPVSRRRLRGVTLRDEGQSARMSHFFCSVNDLWLATRKNLVSQVIELPLIPDGINFSTDLQMRDIFLIKEIKMIAKLEDVSGAGHIGELIADAIDLTLNNQNNFKLEISTHVRSETKTLQRLAILLRRMQHVRSLIDHMMLYQKTPDLIVPQNQLRSAYSLVAASCLNTLFMTGAVLIPIDFMDSNRQGHAMLMFLDDGKNSNQCRATVWDSNGLLSAPRMAPHSLRNYQQKVDRLRISLLEAMTIDQLNPDDPDAKIVPSTSAALIYALSEKKLPLFEGREILNIEVLAELISIPNFRPTENLQLMEKHFLGRLLDIGVFCSQPQRPHSVQGKVDCEWKSCLAFLSSFVSGKVYEAVRAHAFNRLAIDLRELPLEQLPGAKTEEKLAWKVKALQNLEERFSAGMDKAQRSLS